MWLKTLGSPQNATGQYKAEAPLLQEAFFFSRLMHFSLAVFCKPAKFVALKRKMKWT
jgi:hypothetical protein